MAFKINEETDATVKLLQDELQAHYNLMNAWGGVFKNEYVVSTDNIIPNPVDEWIVGSPWGPSLVSFDSCYDGFFHIVERDAHIFSEIEAAKQMLLSLNWHIEDGSSDKVDKDIGDKIRRLFDLMDDGYGNGFDGILNLAWRGVETGMQPLALHWTVWEDWRVPTMITPRPPEMFQYALNQAGEAKLHIKESYGFGNIGELVDPRLIVCVHSNAVPPLRPYGTGMLAPIYLVANFKAFAIWQEVSYMETFGKPMLLIQYAQGAESAVNDMLKGLGGAIRGKAAYPIDSQGNVMFGTKAMDVQFYDANRTATDVYGAFIEQCNKEISKVCIGAPLTTGEARYGTYSLGTVHQITTDIITAGRAKNIEKVINRIIKLVRHFNFRKRPAPKFVFETRSDDKRGPDYINMLGSLLGYGIDIPEKNFLDAAGLAHPQPGDKMVSSSMNGGAGGMYELPAAPLGGEAGFGSTPTEMGTMPTSNMEAPPGEVPTTEMSMGGGGTESGGGVPGLPGVPAGLPTGASMNVLKLAREDVEFLNSSINNYTSKNKRSIIGDMGNLVKNIINKDSNASLKDFLLSDDDSAITSVNMNNISNTIEALYYYGWLRAYSTYNNVLSGQLNSSRNILVPTSIPNKNETISTMKNATRSMISSSNFSTLEDQIRMRANKLSSSILADSLSDFSDLIDIAANDGWDTKKFKKEANTLFKQVHSTKEIPYYIQSAFESAIRQGYNNGLWIMANLSSLKTKVYGFKWVSDLDYPDSHLGHVEANGYIGSLMAFENMNVMPSCTLDCNCFWVPISMLEAKQNGWVEYVGDYPNGAWKILNPEPTSEFPQNFKNNYQPISAAVDKMSLLNNAVDYEDYTIYLSINNVYKENEWLNDNGKKEFSNIIASEFNDMFPGIKLDITWSNNKDSDFFNDTHFVDGPYKKVCKDIEELINANIMSAHEKFSPNTDMFMELNDNILDYCGRDRNKII